jgi:hypothetical protein
LLYHKLFYLVSGALASATGSVKGGLVSAIAILLVTGATGMASTLRALGASRGAAFAAGCCLVAANYTVANWLVRGAMAEFSAAMVMPWLLGFFVRTLQVGRVRLGLGVSLALLWLAHSVLAFYAVLLLGATFGLLAVVGAAPWRVLSPRTAWPAVAACLLLVAPYLLPMAIIGPDYDVSLILTFPYSPAHQFRPIGSYLWDHDFAFGQTWNRISARVDHPMLALLAAGAAGTFLGRRGSAGPWPTVRATLPLCLLLLLVGLLQLRIAAPFYERVPGAAFVQFPWRLMAFITPALIVTAIYLADRGMPGGAGRVAVVGATMWMLDVSGAFVPLRYERLPMPTAVQRTWFGHFGEYQPRGVPARADLAPRVQALWQKNGCRLEQAPEHQEEGPYVHLDAHCARGAMLPLPVYRSPLHMVAVTVGGRRGPPVPCLVVPDAPQLCGAAVPAADSRISVAIPRLSAVPGWAWRSLASRPAPGPRLAPPD